MLFLNGTVAIVGSFSYAPTHLIVYIWLFAFTDGVIQVCCTLMVRETLGLDAYSEGMAVMLTVGSISVVLGPPLLGMHSITFIYFILIFISSKEGCPSANAGLQGALHLLYKITIKNKTNIYYH